MRVSRGAILYAGPGSWRLGTWEGETSAIITMALRGRASGEEVASALPDAIARAQCRGRDVVLALASADCLAAGIATGGLPRKDRRRALAYRLEEHFPFAIEEASCDFAIHNGRALGVCVANEQLNAWIRAIEWSGLRLAGICPSSGLCLQSEDLSEGGAVIWQSAGEADVFIVEEGQPTAWYSVPATVSDVALAMAPHLLASGQAVRITVRGDDAGLSEDLAKLPDFQIADRRAADVDEAALCGARRILAGTVTPAIDLRRDEGLGLARFQRGLSGMVVAGAVLFVCVFGALVWQGMRYSAVADQYQQQKEAAFRAVFPNEPIPIGIASRLRGAADRFHGPSMSARGTDRAATLVLLNKVIAALPAGVRFQADEIDAQPHAVALSGRVLSLVAANQLTASLRRNAALQVDDPRAQTLPDGTVSVSVNVSDQPHPEPQP